MKKLLLAAVALLFTVGASAQDLRLNVSPTMRPQPATFKSFNNLRVDANAGVTMADKAVKPMAKAVQKQPLKVRRVNISSFLMIMWKVCQI